MFHETSIRAGEERVKRAIVEILLRLITMKGENYPQKEEWYIDQSKQAVLCIHSNSRFMRPVFYVRISNMIYSSTEYYARNSSINDM